MDESNIYFLYNKTRGSSFMFSNYLNYLSNEFFI